MKWKEAIRRRKALKWVNKLAITTGYIVFTTVAVTAFLLVLTALGMYVGFDVVGTLVLIFIFSALITWGSLTVQPFDEMD